MHESEHPFTWLSVIPGLQEYPNHVVMVILVGVLLVALTFVARAQLLTVMKSSEGGIVPDSKLTFRNFFEIIAEKLYALTESVIGHHDTPVYFPIIGFLFVFIFPSNMVV